MWQRRQWLGAAGSLAALGSGALANPAQAQFRVEISGVGATQLPIAISRFRNQGNAPQPLSDIIQADLARTGMFRFVDPGSEVDETMAPNFAELKLRGADAIAGGSVTAMPDGRFDVRYKLWDVVAGGDKGGQSLVVPPADLRLAAHRIADDIYEKLTGEKGVFATRIAYVTRGGGRYRLRITDADGENGQVALTSPEPIISPAWSPNGREVAYVSFETKKATVWVQEVATGQRRQIANFRGSNSAPAFSPDGSQVAVTLSQSGGSQIFLMPVAGGTPKRLTTSSAIDTEATFSPDGSSIYFVSDRGGSPQIYRQPVSGGGAARITFNGSYNISPTISPDGRTLAYVTRDNGFRVMRMDLASGQTQAISDTSNDESPSFAPNGRFVIYATRTGGQGVLMTSTVDGRVHNRLLTTGEELREPAWGPFGR